jgi:hypothetical protein
MKRDIQLPLKRKWFEMTKSGNKTEDYREITPYWCSRLLEYRSKKMNQEFWKREFFDFSTIKETAENLKIFTYPVKYKNNIMTLGYPKKTDKERIMKLENKGIYIGAGNEDWGAEPNKIYFVIKHGYIHD